MKRVTLKDLKSTPYNVGVEVLVEQELWERIVETIRYNDNMSGEKFKAPSLGNATPAFLVDELGELRAEIKPRQTYEKLLSGLLKDNHRPENNFLEGEKYTVTFKWVSQDRFNQEKFADYLAHPEKYPNPQYGDFTKRVEYWECRTALKGSPPRNEFITKG